jgi:hypothetical protein
MEPVRFLHSLDHFKSHFAWGLKLAYVLTELDETWYKTLTIFIWVDDSSKSKIATTKKPIYIDKVILYSNFILIMNKHMKNNNWKHVLHYIYSIKLVSVFMILKSQVLVLLVILIPILFLSFTGLAVSMTFLTRAMFWIRV